MFKAIPESPLFRYHAQQSPDTISIGTHERANFDKNVQDCCVLAKTGNPEAVQLGVFDKGVFQYGHPVARYFAQFDSTKGETRLLNLKGMPVSESKYHRVFLSVPPIISMRICNGVARDGLVSDRLCTRGV